MQLSKEFPQSSQLNIAFEQHFKGSYSAILKDGSPTPFIKCNECNKNFHTHKYSSSQERIYNNSVSNILKHVCKNKDLQKNQKLTQMFAKPLSPQLRKQVGRYYARKLIAHPTISVSAGTDLLNENSKEIANLTYSHRQVFDFNVSRQFVTAEIADIGREEKQKASRFFIENYKSSSIIVDHWSHNGINYVGIIGKTFMFDAIKEYLIALEIADSDKTAVGINQNVASILNLSHHQCQTRIPVITDNTYTMVRAFNASNDWNQYFYKVFCVEHLLAKVDEELHKLPIFKDVDEAIVKIDAFFNYRSGKFDLPVKPLNTRSTTRPWRSYRSAFEITIKNYDRYLSIQKERDDFPPIPNYSALKALSKFQAKFCAEFDSLESVDANVKTAIISYMNLSDLAKECEEDFAEIKATLISQLETKIRPKIFNITTLAFIVLSRMDFRSIFYLLS